MNEQITDQSKLSHIHPTIRHLVCLCVMPGQDPFGAKCKKCDKYFRFRVATCRECKQGFLTLFKHPAKCIGVPVCYECLGDRGPCDCLTDMGRRERGIGIVTEKVPPAADFKPKTLEDMIAILDDDFELDF